MVTVTIEFAQGSARVQFASLLELSTALRLLKLAQEGGRGIVDIAIKRPAPDVQFERGKVFVSRDCVARAKRAKFDIVHVLVISKQAIEHSINESNQTA